TRLCLCRKKEETAYLTRVFLCYSLHRRPAQYNPPCPGEIRHRSPARTWRASKEKQAAMDSFSSPSSSGNPNPEVIMEQIKTQLAQAYAQELLETVGSKCFEKCVTKPGSSLSGSESSCISRCVDRYIEATGIVSRALFSPQR
ncbi:hypothetical protein EJB05_19529, partial [Eragrostis curvula]